MAKIATMHDNVDSLINCFSTKIMASTDAYSLRDAKKLLVFSCVDSLDEVFFFGFSFITRVRAILTVFGVI
jgi:hypothetical protein